MVQKRRLVHIRPAIEPQPVRSQPKEYRLVGQIRDQNISLGNSSFLWRSSGNSSAKEAFVVDRALSLSAYIYSQKRTQISAMLTAEPKAPARNTAFQVCNLNCLGATGIVAISYISR